MFLQLFKLKTTLYFFLAGYILTFITSIIQQERIMRILWVSFVGGIVCIGIWSVLIKMIIFLLSEEEINGIFKISGKESSKKEYQSFDFEDSELTAEELYGNLKQTENTDAFNLSLNNNTAFLDATTLNSETQKLGTAHVDSQTGGQKVLKEGYEITPDGKFDFTIGGKTLHADPKEGAQAIRKVLSDDKKIIKQ